MINRVPKEFMAEVKGVLSGMGILSNIPDVYDHQMYTSSHYYAFCSASKILTNSIPGSALQHDLDKLILYGIYNDTKLVGSAHRKYARHHLDNWATDRDMIDTILDFECARYTKPDKPLNAYNTIMKYSPEYYARFKPILASMGIDGPNNIDIPIFLEPLDLSIGDYIYSTSLALKESAGRFMGKRNYIDKVMSNYHRYCY